MDKKERFMAKVAVMLLLRENYYLPDEEIGYITGMNLVAVNTYMRIILDYIKRKDAYERFGTTPERVREVEMEMDAPGRRQGR